MEDILKQILNDMDKWEESVRISDNPNDNPLVDAYNEGANAMASKVKFYLNVIYTANDGGKRK